MRAFFAFTKKEITFQIRSKRFMILAIIFAFLMGGIIGYIGGYYTRKIEEPKDIRKLVDGWKYKSREY